MGVRKLNGKQSERDCLCGPIEMLCACLYLVIGMTIELQMNSIPSLFSELLDMPVLLYLKSLLQLICYEA